MHMKREYLDVRASEWLIWALVSNAVSKVISSIYFSTHLLFSLKCFEDSSTIKIPDILIVVITPYSAV